MEENCSFAESCLNLALKKSSHFISSFPTKVVFGKCCQNGYKKAQCFQFELSELYKLYCGVFEIVKFFALNIELERQLLLTKCNNNYFLVGKILCVNNEETKVAVFGIECLLDEQSEPYQLFFTDIELNDFVYALIKIIPSALCLNTKELQLFQKASHESSKAIKLFRTEKHCEIFVRQNINNLNKEVLDVSIYNLSTFLNYYCEIILISHKFQTLLNKDKIFDNIDTIISKVH
jgi:hypothetical protein